MQIATGHHTTTTIIANDIFNKEVADKTKPRSNSVKHFRRVGSASMLPPRFSDFLLRKKEIGNV